MKIILSFLFVFSANLFAQDSIYHHKSILKYRNYSQNGNLSNLERLNYAKIASELSYKSNVDSVILNSNRNLSRLYRLNDSIEGYGQVNYINLELSTKLKDTLSLVASYHNLGSYFLIENKNDSSYYYYSKALKLYNRLDNFEQQAIMLLNIADIRETARDYIGAENSATLALNALKKVDDTEDILDTKWILYNLLGITSLKQKLHQDALDYHEKALAISTNMVDGLYNELYSIHNKARVYKIMEDYGTALKLYNKALKRIDLYKEDPEFYALIIDNIAEARFLNGDSKDDEILNLYNRAYKISDSLNDKYTKAAVTIDLANFYVHLKEQDSALKYARESRLMSKSTGINEILLESYTLLAQLTEGEEKVSYLNEHIKLNDSLINNERTARNKFARVQFETDQIKAENVQISRERLWFLILSAGLLVTVLLLYVIFSQRAKNRELQLSQQQQIANEEIYNLMLAQQDKIDEGRATEKKRMSEELHDGILSRLFGTRLSLDSLNMVHTDEAVKNRSNYINELKTIEQEIRKISHDLNTDFVANSGFVDIVESLIETQTNAYQLSYDFEIDDSIEWEEVSNKDKIHLYRIVQESLQNVHKHAKASHVKIGFALKNNVLLVSINDDGAGFEINKAKKGIGIKNINSRVVKLNGELAIDSVIDQGTTILIKVPV